MLFKTNITNLLEVMRKLSKNIFVISNYQNNDSFCDDMTALAEMIFRPEETYSVKWLQEEQVEHQRNN